MSCTRQTSEGVILKIDSKEWSHLRLTQCLRQNTNGFHDSLICCTVENDMYAGVDADCHFKGDHFFFPDDCFGEVLIMCVCVYLCAGDEGSVVQSFCCGSSREEKQTGWWKVEVVFFSFLLQ